MSVSKDPAQDTCGDLCIRIRKANRTLYCENISSSGLLVVEYLQVNATVLHAIPIGRCSLVPDAPLSIYLFTSQRPHDLRDTPQVTAGHRVGCDRVRDTGRSVSSSSAEYSRWNKRATITSHQSVFYSARVARIS